MLNGAVSWIFENPLNFNPFWEEASAEPPLEWSKWAAVLEMAVFAKDEIEVRNLLRTKPPLIKPAKPIYEVKITGKTERRTKLVTLETNRVEWENLVQKARDQVCCVIHFVGTRRMQKSAVTFFYASAQSCNDRYNRRNQPSTCTPSNSL